uniref:Aminotransferase-like plant mobile domain-containing protein n=1 Tax=Fagus sylvatica TaxID=28930 RepID=A0A2N9FKH1_FAGSY
MRGGRVGFIENRARLAQHHHARRMTVLRELWYCHVAVLSFHASSPSNPPRFPCAYPFLSDFRGQFWRSSGTQNGSCGISSESSRRPLSNDIKFARIGVRTRELWLPEVGVSELFSCTLPVKIPIKRGMLSANREFHDVAGVIIFPTHPGSRINLLRAGKTLRAKAAVREKKCVLLPARFFSNLVPVPDSRESELGLVRYGPASRVHRGVFGPFEGSFPIRIPADPDKFLAIREFHVVHGCVLFPMCPGSQINLLRVRKTLCASVATSALHRGELGFARYDPANGGRGSLRTEAVKGSCSLCLRFRLDRRSSEIRTGGVDPKVAGGQFDPVFGLVNGPVKPWSNLVNLGQTWSDLVKALQTLGNVSRTSFQGFLGKADPSRAGNSSVKPRALVGSDRLGSGCLVLRADTRENPGGKNGVMTPVDWSAILGIRFGGRAPPSEPIDGFEAREILGLADRDAIEGTRRPSVRIRHLADVLRRDREEPPTELRYRHFLGFWQFTVFWAFEHFPTFAPSRLPLASDPDFPLARRWDTSRIERMTTCTLLELRMTVDCLRDADIIFQPYSAALSQRPEVFRAVALSRLRLWIRTTRSWELLLGERTVRQLGDEAVVPVDPSPLMTIEDYIPRAPSDPYIAGVSAYPSLVREGVPYQEWFEQVSLGSLMSLHEVEGGRVMGGVAMDSHHIRSSGQIERLEGEILRLQLELSVSVDRHTADMDRVQGERGRWREGEMVQMQRDLAQSQRDLGSRDAERLAARRTEIRGAASWYGHYSCYRS